MNDACEEARDLRVATTHRISDPFARCMSLRHAPLACRYVDAHVGHTLRDARRGDHHRLPGTVHASHPHLIVCYGETHTPNHPIEPVKLHHPPYRSSDFTGCRDYNIRGVKLLVPRTMEGILHEVCSRPLVHSCRQGLLGGRPKRLTCLVLARVAPQMHFSVSR
jgi:hypothetical protein